MEETDSSNADLGSAESKFSCIESLSFEDSK